MGNIQNLDKNHFFQKLKSSSSYKDFVIKMNQLLSRSSTIWKYKRDYLNNSDIEQNREKIENFFLYVTEYIFERSVKKKSPTKNELQNVSAFLQVLNHLVVQIAEFNIDFFDKLFFRTISKEFQIQIIKNGQDQQLKINDEDNYNGEFEQIPIFIKLLYSCIQLFDKNNYAISYKDEIYNADFRLWNSSQQTENIIKNRNNLIQLILRIILIEKYLSELKNQKGIATIVLLQSYKNSQDIISWIIYSSLYYKENGIFPYSAYFYKEQLEDNLQTSLLSLQLAILLLKNYSQETISDLNERVKLVQFFISKNDLQNQKDFKVIFENQIFVKKILKKIIQNLNTFFEKDDTILPKSFLESPLNKDIILLFLIFIITSEQCQRDILQQKSNYNILMNLIIILDQVSLDFSNAMYYCTCSVLLELSTRILKRSFSYFKIK